MKKSFILLSTLFILIIFSYLSVTIIQNQAYSDKINTLKYYEIQALIHLKYIKQKLKNNIPINKISINDNKYTLHIIKKDTYYFINIKHKTEHISINYNLSLD